MTKTSESIQQPLHEWLLATHMFPAHQRRKDVPRLSYSLSMTNILIPFIPFAVFDMLYSYLCLGHLVSVCDGSAL